MLSKILTTPIDDLVEIVKSNHDCSVSFLQQKLNLPLDVIEKWLVVLEEYKVIKVNYSGFEGYVNYVTSAKDVDAKNKKAQQVDINKLKEVFIEKSTSRNLNDEQMRSIWPNFVLSYEADIRNLFFEMAQSKGYDQFKIADAWNKYREELIKF